MSDLRLHQIAMLASKVVTYWDKAAVETDGTRRCQIDEALEHYIDRLREDLANIAVDPDLAALTEERDELKARMHKWVHRWLPKLRQDRMFAWDEARRENERAVQAERQVKNLEKLLLEAIERIDRGGRDG